MYGRPTEVTAQVDRDEVRQEARDHGGEPGGVPGRATTSARPPSCSPTRTRSSRRRSRPARTGTSAGTTALAWGLIAASAKSGLPIFYASYPITPASELLHELSRHKNFGVRTLQAEDEIAAAGGGPRGVRSAGTSASPAPAVRASTSSRRRSAWPSCSSCRWSSSTSSGPARRPGCRPRPRRPTCSPRCSAGTASPRCRSSPPPPRRTASRRPIEAVRIAVTYRTPVILLSDTFLTNSSEPWRLPDVDDAPDRSTPTVRHRGEPRRRVHALPPRREPGPAVGRPGYARAASTGSAGSRSRT